MVGDIDQRPDQGSAVETTRSIVHSRVRRSRLSRSDAEQQEIVSETNQLDDAAAGTSDEEEDEEEEEKHVVDQQWIADENDSELLPPSATNPSSQTNLEEQTAQTYPLIEKKSQRRRNPSNNKHSLSVPGYIAKIFITGFPG